MVKLIIDGRAVEVQPDQNLLQASLSVNADIPYFCWHPALGAVGSCRQCAVRVYRDDDDQVGQIVMSCMTKLREGMRVSIAEREVAALRESVVEMVLANHPHDCPVCEVGGECHLQDMAVMTGHSERRYEFQKRTHLNQNLGPFIKHEMNRCIGCYRCVRFYRDYAGGDDFGVFGSRANIYFGRASEGALESPFAGNLVEICPTGVFVDKPFSKKFRRKWDMRGTASVCGHCAVGCNVTLQEREGELRRVVNRYNDAVNGYFLCDRGRFGADYVQSEHTLRSARLAGSAELAVNEARAALAHVLATPDLIGIGSPRASLESNFALRAIVGPENFYLGIHDTAYDMLDVAVRLIRNARMTVASVRDVEQADSVLIIGEDPSETAPRLALALRQAGSAGVHARANRNAIPLWQDISVRDNGCETPGALMIMSPAATELDDVAWLALRVRPDEAIARAAMIAHAIDPQAPPCVDMPGIMPMQVEQMAAALLAAERPLIVVGCMTGDADALRAGANIVEALMRCGKQARLSFIAPEVNAVGVALLGGGRMSACFERLAAGSANIVVLENDLYRRFPHNLIDRVFKQAGSVTVLDHIETQTTAQAGLALPVASMAESDGIVVNQEGRAQRFYKAIFRQTPSLPAWQILRDAANVSNWPTLSALVRVMSGTVEGLEHIVEVGLDAAFRIEGIQPASQPHRYSGRTAVNAHHDVQEQAPPSNEYSPFATSMEGYHGAQAGVPVPFFWSPGWNSVQSVNKFQSEIGGALRHGDDGVKLGGKDQESSGYWPVTVRPAEPAVLLFIPCLPVFGGEELSALSPAIEARMAVPTASMNIRTAALHQITEGATMDYVTQGASMRLVTEIDDHLPDHVVQIVAGYPGQPPLPGPVHGHVRHITARADG
jgi:NADH-quinone oxidoreductase subunit G